MTDKEYKDTVLDLLHSISKSLDIIADDIKRRHRLESGY